MRFRLLPTDDRFFDLFNEAALNAAECAKNLRDLIDDDSGERTHEEVLKCERRGDELTQDILQRLNTSFVTPFDREDIHALAEELDDVVDDIYQVGALLQILSVGEPLPELIEQAHLLVRTAGEVVALIDRLESMKDTKGLLEPIDKLESE